MRVIQSSDLIDPLKEKLLYCLTHVEPAVNNLLQTACLRESGAAKWALEQILENNAYAAATNCPACQDTGLCVFFVEIGQEIHVEGDLTQVINEAVRRAYTEGYFRKSVVRSPLDRVNTEDNTPAIIHIALVAGDKLTVRFLAKGAGSENMGALYMLTPSKGRRGIIDSVLECVTRAGANPCPPILIGVGVGGDMELAAILSKRALTRESGTPSTDPLIAALEQDILTQVNQTDIGVQGFGGATTALAVAVETAPTHIGMMPVAVNIQCHSVRHFTAEF